MRILHITFGLPPYSNGGLPLYVERLATEQKEYGHSVVILEPGSLIPKKPTIKQIRNKMHTIYRIYPALPVANNFGVSNPEKCMTAINPSVYRDFLRKIKPDIIHIHSIMGIHKEFFTTAKTLGIKLIMTTHDYYGIDLRANFVDTAGNAYIDRNPAKVAERNYNIGVPYKKQLILQTNIYKRLKNSKILSIVRRKQRMELENNHQNPQKITPEIVKAYSRLLRYYDEILAQIDYFIFNSSVAEDIYKKFIPNTKGEIVHPVSGVCPSKKEKKSSDGHNSIKKIIYIGRAEKYKGVDVLASAMRDFPEIQCYLYGDDYNSYEAPNVHSMGAFEHGDLQDMLNDVDLLVMPSRCYETFAFPVLEALNAGVPVLVSSHVGAKDLVSNAPVQVVFEPTVENLRKYIRLLQNQKNLKAYRTWIEDMQATCVPNRHDKIIEKIYKKVLSC